MRYLIILCLLISGCATTTKNENGDTKDIIRCEDRKDVFKVYDKNIPNTIILAYERVYSNTFDIAKYYLQYNKTTKEPTYDGFWIWLCKNIWYKDAFDKGDEFGVYRKLIETRFQDREYQDIKMNYELLERIKKNGYKK